MVYEVLLFPEGCGRGLQKNPFRSGGGGGVGGRIVS